MKQFLFFLFSLISGIFVFFLIVGQVGWQDIMEPLLLFPIWKIGVIIILALLIILAVTYKWKLILETKKSRISKTTLWKIVMSNFLVSYLTPIIFFANEVLVVRLIKRNNISRNKAIAFVFIEKIIAMTVSFFLIAIGILSFFFLTAEPLNFIILISTAVIIIFIIILAFFYWRFYNQKSIFKYFFKIFRLKNFENSKAKNIEKELFVFFNFKNRAIKKIFAVTFLIHILIFIQYWFLVFFLIRNTLNILETFSLYAFIQIAHFLPFPAALGVLELSSKLIFDTLGLGSGVAIAFSLILRAVMLLISLIGAICLTNLLLGLLRIRIKKNNTTDSDVKILRKQNTS